MSDPLPTEEELEKFRQAQRLAYQCAQDVADGLELGVTEREVARRLGERTRRAGADGWFHTPLVFFGERTSFEGMRNRFQVGPSDLALTAEMPVLFDLAPVFHGVPADVSLTFSLGRNRTLDRARRELGGLRDHIPELVGQGLDARSIVRAIVAYGAERGWSSVQDSYLFGAFAHRVFRVRPSRLSRHLFLGLGLPTAVSLYGRALAHRIVRTPWPFWNDSGSSEQRPTPGLWSVEPHFALDGVGTKWEELLLVTPTGARWLEDEPLHALV